MKKQTSSMGMPVSIVIVDNHAKEVDIDTIFMYLQHVDEVFSTYKPTSEISQINGGSLKISQATQEIQHVLTLCEETKKETNGYFDMQKNRKIDPSGIVKGYAIHEAASMLRKNGYTNFYVEIAGDIEVAGNNKKGEMWRVGLENPFNRKEIIKVIGITDCGIATSGNYIRGKHIYNPIAKKDADEVASISVIGPNVYEADRFATAAFAMGENGIEFIERLKGFEGYMIRKDKTAVYTSGFDKFVIQ